MGKPAALRKVARAARARDQAAEGYAQALHDAHEAGASWPEIARAAGKDVSGVFNFAKRHPRKPT